MKNNNELISNSILSVELDYGKTNILVLTSNYISRNRKIISNGITEYTVFKEVDSEVTQVKESGPISEFINQFVEDVKPYCMFRVQIISKEDEDPAWHTLLNINN